MRNWLLPAITGVAGLAAGWWLAGSDAPSVEAQQPVAVVTNAQGSPTVSPAYSQGSLTTEDVRRILREELAAARNAVAGGPTASGNGAGTALAAIEPTAAQTQTYERASGVLNGAIARRQWTDADNDAMRAEMHKLTPEQQFELMRQFSVAVNKGLIQPEAERLPF